MRGISMRGAAALAAMIAIMSCAEHGPTEVIGPVRVASVDVVLARTALVAGDSTIASATAHDATGNVMRGLPVVWSSDNPLVATVSADGLVHTMSAGNARIIALIDLVGSYGAISVSPAPVATVKVTLAATALTPGHASHRGDRRRERRCAHRSHRYLELRRTERRDRVLNGIGVGGGARLGDDHRDE